MSQQSRLFLVDGMALLFRSFYAMGQANLTSPDGKPIGAVYGFMRVICKILKEQKSSHLAVLWDTKEKTFRHEMFPDYKANRSEPPEEIIPQIGLIQELLETLGVPSFRKPGFEADDLVGTLATACQSWAEVYIVSADKDFMQLVNDRVKMYSLKKGDEHVIIDPTHVEDKFGVAPERVIDVLAIMGDSSDNVPGVKGIGEKGASKLIQEFGSLESVYENLEKITAKRQKSLLTESRELALLSKKLVIIDCDVPLNYGERDLVYTYESLCLGPKLKVTLNELGMHSLLRSLLGDAAGLEKVHLPDAQVGQSGPDSDRPSESVDSDTLFAETSEEDRADDGPSAREKLLAAWGKRDYVLVHTKEAFQHLCERISSPHTLEFAFDTETTGLDLLIDKPIGCSFCFAQGEAFYVPVFADHLHQAQEIAKPGEVCLNDREVIAGQLQEALRTRTATLVAHNAKYDLHMLSNWGVDWGEAPVACSMVASWMVNAQGGGYGLDAQSAKVLGLEKIPTSDLIGKKAGRETMKEVPLSELVEYACEDVDATLRLWKLHSKGLREKSLFSLFWELEMPLLSVLLDMERTGVHIDSGHLADLTVELQDRLTEIEAEIFEKSGETFKISSPKQLGAVLFEKLKIHEELGFKGKLARTSLGFKTDAGVLEKFSAHPVVQLVQEFRELSKLLSTYIIVLPQLVKESTGRIHTSYHQPGTATGRLSSSDPNLQNIPVRSEWGKKVRQAFSAKDKDHCIMALDYSQIELRILAHLADDETMIEAFQSGRDIHRETAAKIHGLNPERVTPEERSAAKAINFGIIYGMGPQRLAREQNVSTAEAKAFIEKYFLNFSKIRNFLDSCRESAHEKGYAITAFGRLRPLPQLQSKNQGEARQAENMAINSPIQGTAADIMKLGMLKVHRLLKEKAPDCHMIMQVHDELVFECPRHRAEEVGALIKGALESVVDYRVPLTVDVGMGENWLEAK